MRFLVIFIGLFVMGCAVSVHDKMASSSLIDARLAFDSQNFTLAKQGYEVASLSKDILISSEGFYGLARVAKVQKRYSDAITYTEKAALINPDKFNDELAAVYLRYGSLSQKNKAVSIYKELVTSDAKANIALANWEQSQGNVNRAEEYFARARDLLMQRYRLKNDDNGQVALELGRLYANQKNCEASEEWFRKSIEQANMDAVHELADLWLVCKNRDNTKADVFALLSQAAEQGDNKAIRYVADSYRDGNGVAQDIDKAYAWYQKLDGGANTKTLVFLADYLMFDAKRTDEKKAGELYAKVASLSSERTYPVLMASALGYDTGIVVDVNDMLLEAQAVEKKYSAKNPALIEKIYVYLAKSGNADAMFRLSELYQKDQPSKASEWLEKSLTAGSVDALLARARSYSMDTKDSNALAKAFDLYKKAAEQGSGEGQFQTGIMLARGTGVDKDMDAATQWLLKAQGNGYAMAAEMLETLK